MKKIEILVVNHKPSFVPENDLLKPIQVGSALTDHKLKNMSYYDNHGDNISDKNKSYCELTATYWAWKNLDADYYGLFHYRRYLSFAPDSIDNPFAGQAFANIPSSLEDIHINETDMRALIEQYDLIIPRKDDTKATTGEASLYEQYANEHYIKDLDYCIAYIEKKYPHISPYLSTLHDHKAYFCNMFIMKKELFTEYASFMFDVLDSFEENTDIGGYNLQQYRVTGFIAERLTNVFLHYLIGTGGYKVKELQIAYFENTDPVPNIKPVSEENSVGIVLAADDFYTPYVSTLIGSLAEHASDNNVYDVNIFHRNITPHNQNLLKGEFGHLNNVHIRFCDMSSRMSEFEGLATKWHITIETYFRLFIPEVMEGYNKVLYLDGDMIIKRDVADLFNENIEGYMLAACKDVDMAGVYSSNTVAAENTINPKMKEYIDSQIALKSPYDYFQAGVLLLNLEEMRKSFTTSEIMNLAGAKKWEYLDQDILNYVAQGKVKFLDLRWNTLYDWEYVRIKNVISKAPVKLYDEYMESRKDPFIIHYGGTIKPWQRADADFAEEYWRIARKSVYYELILSRMSVWSNKHKVDENKPEKLRLRTRVVRKLRRGADVIAPMGTNRRKPITLASRLIKKHL